MNRDTAIAHFKALGARCETRRYPERDVVGIQLRHSAVTDDDLAFLEHLRDDVDVVGLEGTKISDAGLAHLVRLQAALPECEIVCDFELERDDAPFSG